MRARSIWSEAGDEVAALTGDLGGTLRIGAITTAEYLIPPLLVKFTATRPHVKTYFKVGNRDDIIRMLATHEIDLAVMGSAPKELRTHAVEFAKHPMVFVAAPGHPLMQRKRVALKDLESAHLLVRERGAGTRSTVESLFKNAGYRFHVAELSSNEAIKQMAEAGSAWRSCRCTRVHSNCAPGCSGNCRSPATRSSASGMWLRSPTGAFRRSRAVPRFPDQAGRAGDRRRDGGARAAAQGGCVDRPVRRLEVVVAVGDRREQPFEPGPADDAQAPGDDGGEGGAVVAGPDEGRLAAEGERAVNAARCTRH